MYWRINEILNNNKFKWNITRVYSKYSTIIDTLVNFFWLICKILCILEN